MTSDPDRPYRRFAAVSSSGLATSESSFETRPVARFIPHSAKHGQRFSSVPCTAALVFKVLLQPMRLAASAATRFRMRGKRTAHDRHRSAVEALQPPVL